MYDASVACLPYPVGRVLCGAGRGAEGRRGGRKKKRAPPVLCYFSAAGYAGWRLRKVFPFQQ
ncbi:hypothetical protein CANARDRAFT_26981 [[Candida] arabinofermentans NRRL YB-2248]|uniref:Uncharacterized protein n=1 Tax=[Candida] arabinofermentans NRRL YB-2248 TaxID=983967 RepID=A0A1E4T773_9ASCO|nr:hypothetical protein CANARDRAFT_26981 [[Candida] arabinofermentans NRRL YB-2248]